MWICEKGNHCVDSCDGCEHYIEVEEVRHGYWIPVDGDFPCDEWDCSSCMERMTFMYEMDEDDMKENFLRCPKCGAIMDLEIL